SSPRRSGGNDLTLLVLSSPYAGSLPPVRGTSSPQEEHPHNRTGSSSRSRRMSRYHYGVILAFSKDVSVRLRSHPRFFEGCLGKITEPPSLFRRMSRYDY